MEKIRGMLRAKWEKKKEIKVDENIYKVNENVVKFLPDTGEEVELTFDKDERVSFVRKIEEKTEETKNGEKKINGVVIAISEKTGGVKIGEKWYNTTEKVREYMYHNKIDVDDEVEATLDKEEKTISFIRKTEAQNEETAQKQTDFPLSAYIETTQSKKEITFDYKEKYEEALKIAVELNERTGQKLSIEHITQIAQRIFEAMHSEYISEKIQQYKKENIKEVRR